jgi:hypothetical protein
LLVFVVFWLLEAPDAIILVCALLIVRSIHQLLNSQRVHHTGLELMLSHSVHLPVDRVLLLPFEHELEDLHHILVVFVLLDDICGLLDLKGGQLLGIHVGDLAY